MHVYCHYFEHTTITHICNHLKQLIKFNYLQYKKSKKYNNAFSGFAQNICSVIIAQDNCIPEILFKT